MSAPASVGNYQLVRLLGEGGMGAVYLGEHVQGGLRAAIKVLLPHVSANRQIVARFFNEARATNRIEHPGIVKVFDMGFAETGQAYLAMELLDGQSLASAMAGGPMEQARAIEIARQVAGALDAAHQAGIVHRDLKPDNVYLVRDPDMRFGERAKVLDFGIAKLTGSLALSQATHATMGTPTYMSPEQWRDSGQVDGRTDVYSLGCMLFEMLTGRPPFLGQSLAELCHQHVYEAPPDLATLSPTTPASIASLVAAMIEKDRERRIGTMQAAAARLQAPHSPAAAPVASHQLATVVATRSPLNTTLGEGAGQIATRSSRTRTWMVAGVGTAVAGTVTVAILIAGRDGEDEVRSRAADASVASRALASVDAAAAPVEVNPYIGLGPAPEGLILGVSAAHADAGELGFRPDRRTAAPVSPFAIQQHEVSWAEIASAAAQHPELDFAMPSDVASRGQLPATGIPWELADAYCRVAEGATLPTEAQWEFAARGAELRASPWGNDPPPAGQLAAFRGAGATVAAVMSSALDVTPEGVHDLAGNAREWTADPWSADDGTVPHDGDREYRAVRGLPLDARAPARFPSILAAYRRPLCSNRCPDDLAAKLQTVGFRCVRRGG